MSAEATKNSGAGPEDTRYIFGPVVSRRLGWSLGIDPVPTKTCNWNCVYCQLGRTRPFQTAREAYVPLHEVLREMERVLPALSSNSLDWVTFVGSGETLLHRDLGRMIRRAKELTELPIAVITNGSFLSDPAVREEIRPVDAVLPSLDAGTETLFRRINRPHPQFSFQSQVMGLQEFQADYPGKLLLEIMLLQGLNDTREALLDLSAVISRIAPDGIHLTRPDRPPAEPWVAPSDDEGFLRALEILGPTAKVIHPVEDALTLDSPDAALERVLGILDRHPLSERQLRRALANWPTTEARALLASLESSPRVKTVARGQEVFWVSRKARFPEDAPHS
jgi:wyosine [tRNA(Phe)-imidazoG37] synthetase (radical SAM superfamily)